MTLSQGIRATLGLALIGVMGAAPGAPAQPQVLVERVDHTGQATYTLMSPEALATHQQAFRAEDALYPQVLRLTMLAWQADETLRRKPFPRSAINRPSLKVLGSFPDRAKADAALAEAQGRAERARTRDARPDNQSAQTLFQQQQQQVQTDKAAEAAAARQSEVLRAAARGRATPLADLMPAKVEYGMVDNSPPEWNLAKGPFVLDQNQYGQMNKHWPGGMKVVPGIPATFRLPAGERYSSFMTNAFASAGAFITGVGLLMPINCCYHWIDYDIPPNAKTLSGALFLGDDVHGISFHLQNEMVNRFIFRIEVDGKQVFDHFVQRWSALDGSGYKLSDFSIDLPTGATRVRFYAEATCNDNNHNNELILNETYFTF